MPEDETLECIRPDCPGPVELIKGTRSDGTAAYETSQIQCAHCGLQTYAYDAHSSATLPGNQEPELLAVSSWLYGHYSILESAGVDVGDQELGHESEHAAQNGSEADQGELG